MSSFLPRSRLGQIHYWQSRRGTTDENQKIYIAKTLVHLFDHRDTIDYNGVEYLVVSQPLASDKHLFFIYKDPPGMANPPVFISEGKTLRCIY